MRNKCIGYKLYSLSISHPEQKTIYEDGSESSDIGVITFFYSHARLLYDTLIGRATFLLYKDAKIIHERNKYFEKDALKDTWGKTTGTFS